MKLVQTISLTLGALALAAIAVMQGMRYFSTSVTASVPQSVSGYSIEALAVNLTILQMVMGVVGVFLTVLGVLGWTTIKSAAIERAREAAEAEARKTVSEQLLKLREAQGADAAGLNESPGSYAVGDEPIEGATPAGETE